MAFCGTYIPPRIYLQLLQYTLDLSTGLFNYTGALSVLTISILPVLQCQYQTLSDNWYLVLPCD